MDKDAAMKFLADLMAINAPPSAGIPDDSTFGGVRGCGNCARSYQGKDDDHVGCGASYEDNPIWAARKYSLVGMKTALSGTKQYLGQDCDDMRSDDGNTCKAWEARLVRS
jgi:hypothetical protein